MYLSDKDKKFVKEGAEVAIVNTSGWGSRLIGTSTIEKVLKTQIVLANGRRFKASDHEEHGRGGSRYSDRIVAIDNPLVARIEVERQRQEAKSAAHVAVDDWLRSREDRTRLRAAIEAMTAYEVVLTAEQAEFEADDDDDESVL